MIRADMSGSSKVAAIVRQYSHLECINPLKGYQEGAQNARTVVGDVLEIESAAGVQSGRNDVV
jgi:hypothetical protein